MRSHHKKRLLTACVLIGYLVIMLALWFVASRYLLDQAEIRHTVRTFGVAGPLAIFLIHVVFAVFVPLYTTPLQIAGGYLFGPYLGFLVNYTASVVGLFLIVLLVRRFGRRIFVGLFDRKVLRKYDRFVESAKVSPFVFFVILIVPFMPANEIMYLLALSDIRFRSYVPAILLGVIPKASLAFVGDRMLHGVLPTAAVFAGTLLIGTLIFHHHWIIGRARGAFHIKK